jgi:sorting nexin-4
VAERDRLAALNTGHSGAPVGISTFLRDKVDQLRGTDDIHTRRERIRKLDIKIKEVSHDIGLSSCCCAYVIPPSVSMTSQLQDAVTGAHETSTEFSEEIIKEHNIFELSKQAEMKDMMGAYADGQIEMHQRVSSRDDLMLCL